MASGSGRLGFKKPLRTQLADSAKGLQQLKQLHGISDEGQAHLTQIQAGVDADAARHAKRKPRQPSAGPSEADVQKSIIQYLLLHPRIAMVERINSGAVYGESAAGKASYIRFHTLYVPSRYRDMRYRVVDLNCMLVDGRCFAIEVKRPGWTKPTDNREREQENYLRHVRRHGGIGIFATSIDDVEAALNIHR